MRWVFVLLRHYSIIGYFTKKGKQEKTIHFFMITP